jgi:hypothetical protein
MENTNSAMKTSFGLRRSRLDSQCNPLPLSLSQFLTLQSFLGSGNDELYIRYFEVNEYRSRLACSARVFLLSNTIPPQIISSKITLTSSKLLSMSASQTRRKCSSKASTKTLKYPQNQYSEVSLDCLLLSWLRHFLFIFSFTKMRSSIASSDSLSSTIKTT